MVRGAVVALGGGDAEPVLVAGAFLQTSTFEFYDGLDALGQAGVHFAATLAIGFVVLGLLPGYTRRVVDLARRSPVISVVIGVPTAAVLVTLLAIGQLIAETNLGVFFAIPLVTVSFTVLPPFAAFGFTVLGAMIGSRLGGQAAGVWIVLGGVVAGAAAIAPEVTLAALALTVVVGAGAGVRVAADTGLVNEPDERTVPPANNV